MDYRVIDTNTLIMINNKALENDLNRAINPEWVTDNVDPEGMHVLSPFMVHEHKAGKLTDPHYRCQVLVKVKDRAEAESLWLDIYFEDFNKLPKPLSPAV